MKLSLASEPRVRYIAVRNEKTMVWWIDLSTCSFDAQLMSKFFMPSIRRDKKVDTRITVAITYNS